MSACRLYDLSLVGVGREEQRQQRDREDGERSDTDNGGVSEQALVGLVDFHGWLHSLRRAEITGEQ